MMSRIQRKWNAAGKTMWNGTDMILPISKILRRPLIFICSQAFPLWETHLLQETGPFVTLSRLRSKLGIIKLLCLESFGSLNSEGK